MAVWVPWARVLVAGDYLSPVEIPMLSPGGSVAAYIATLNRLEPLVEQADHVVPGHGGPIDGTRALAILREDRAYLEALQRGEDARAADRAPDQGPARDPREEPHAAMSSHGSVGGLDDLDVAQPRDAEVDRVAVAENGALDADAVVPGAVAAAVVEQVGLAVLADDQRVPARDATGRRSRRPRSGCARGG